MRSLWIEDFSRTDPNQTGGKSLFCYRLGKYLQDNKLFQVTDDRSKIVDISLNVIQIHNPNAKKKVLRLDGVWHDTGKKYKDKNIGMTRALKACDAVVYQSEFAKKMADTFLGRTDKPFAIIHNGTIVTPRTTIPTENLFIAFSKWRPHKRLEDIIECFLLADIPSSVLVIAGELDKSGISEKKLCTYKKNPRLCFLGNVTQDVLASYLKRVVASIHLCWFDACPNSVVEALCSGVPVITNNVGGTHEIVEKVIGDKNLICDIDTPYNYVPVDLYHPPKIDRRKVAEAIYYSWKNNPQVNTSVISIERAAKEYTNFFESLL